MTRSRDIRLNFVDDVIVRKRDTPGYYIIEYFPFQRLNLQVVVVKAEEGPISK